MKPAAGTACPCTPRLLLVPENNKFTLLNKADWQPVGTAFCNSKGQLQNISIVPSAQRQGLATELWQALPAQLRPAQLPTPLDDTLTSTAKAWLTSLGWNRDSARLPTPAAPDFLDHQRQQALMWAEELGIPSNYSQVRNLPVVNEPGLLECVGVDYQRRALYLTPDAARAWKRLRQAGAKDNIELLPVSGFRSIGYQGALVAGRLSAGGHLTEILKVSAAPGYSEHHSGAALDLTTADSPPLQSSFADTDAFRWLTLNAEQWGFTLSYPENNPHQLAFEPWHWCFRNPPVS